MVTENVQSADVLRLMAKAYACLLELVNQSPSNIEPCRRLLWVLSDIEIMVRKRSVGDLPVYDFNEYLLYLLDMQRTKRNAFQKRQAEEFRAHVTEWIQRVGASS